MLAAGWTPEQFDERLPKYSVMQIALALNPEAARGDYKHEGAGPMVYDPEERPLAPGIPIE